MNELLKFSEYLQEHCTNISRRQWIKNMTDKYFNNLPESEASRVIEKEQGEIKCECTASVGITRSGYMYCTACGKRRI